MSGATDYTGTTNLSHSAMTALVAYHDTEKPLKLFRECRAIGAYQCADAASTLDEGLDGAGVRGDWKWPLLQGEKPIDVGFSSRDNETGSGALQSSVSRNLVLQTSTAYRDSRKMNGIRRLRARQRLKCEWDESSFCTHALLGRTTIVSSRPVESVRAAGYCIHGRKGE